MQSILPLSAKLCWHPLQHYAAIRCSESLPPGVNSIIYAAGVHGDPQVAVLSAEAAALHLAGLYCSGWQNSVDGSLSAGGSIPLQPAKTRK